MPEFDQYGNLKTDKDVPNVVFYMAPKADKKASEESGRPIFRNVEMVRISFPADKQRTIERPAHSTTSVMGRQVSYIERWPEQYRRFKAGEAQVADGTPIREAPFLTEAERMTLKVLEVYTVEQLASLEGQSLKNLGPGGVVMKQKAAKYLEVANGTANVTAMSAKIATLEKTVADLSAQGADPRVKFAEMGDDKLKDYIRERTGQAPKGNPSRATLIRMCIEVDAGGTPAEPVGVAA